MDRHVLMLLFILIQLFSLTEAKSQGSSKLPQKLTSHLKQRLRRQTQTPLGNFINDLKTQSLDVVILMDRSAYAGRLNFYKVSRPLVYQTLRYYTRVSPAHVKVTLATFADDFTSHFDGIATEVSKCDMLGTHWSNVLMNTNTLKSEINIQMAFTESERIFARTNRNVKKYLWIISGSYYPLYNNFIPESMANAISSGNMGILVTTVSETSRQAKIKVTNNLISYTGDKITTPRIVFNTLPLQDVEPVSIPSKPDQYCDALGFENLGACADCPSGGQCYASTYPCACFTPQGNTYRCPKEYSFNQGCSAAQPTYCLCTWNGLYTGRSCKEKVQQCIQGACDVNNTCIESTRGYFCKSPANNAYGGGILGFFSTTTGKAVGGGGGGGSSLIGLCVIYYCCCRRRGCDICCDL